MIVRYFICKPKTVNKKRYPEILDKFSLLPISWSAIYYPSLQEATEACIRIEYSDDLLKEIENKIDAVEYKDKQEFKMVVKEQLKWLNNISDFKELKDDKDWESVKGKFHKEKWKDAN